jgi:3-oxoacyl-[acyl-carrier protein] reductase
MNLGLKDKVALVAAASKGLGKAIAFEFSAEGAKVAICARNKETLFKAKNEITSQTKGQVLAFVADVTDKRQVKEMVEGVIKEFGTVEILVSNAGGPPSGMFEDFTLDDYRKALELNLLSTINLCYEVIPLMKKQRWGRIINMTSVAAKQPVNTLILSNTARAGVLGFSKSLSSRLAPFGITVNSVCPGYTKTERVENLAKSFELSGKGRAEDYFKNVEKLVPLGRMAKPEEIAQAVAFLASERASYITGVALQVDGGYISGLF